MCAVAVADLAGLAEEVTRRLHRPSLHGAELAMYASYRKVAESTRVVVYSGHGADEMWGYQDGRYFPILSPSFSPDMHSEYYLKHHLYPDEKPSWHRLVQRFGAALGVPAPVVQDLVWDETFAPTARRGRWTRPSGRACT